MDYYLKRNLIDDIEYKFIVSCFVMMSYEEYLNAIKCTQLSMDLINSREIFKALIMPSPYNITIFVVVLL